MAARAACPACGAPLRVGSRQQTCGILCCPELPRAIADALPLTQTLSPRELATFELLGLGYDNRSIAHELQISERTAKRYITGILDKLRLESRLQAGLVALITASFSATDDLVTRRSHGLSEGSQ